MAKKFFEVFPTLQLNEKTKPLFLDIEVLKVATNSERDYLHVHISSTHLIQKRMIHSVEMAIKEQLFAENPIQIRIVEFYQLSGQYTPENLMREYYDSILYELKERSIVEHNMFASARCTFDNDTTMLLEFEDSIIAEMKSEGIVELLREIFLNRCHIPVEIKVDFRTKKKSKMQEQNALRLQQEVNAIVEEHVAKRQELKAEEDAKREEKKAAKEEKAAKKAVTYRPVKKSDDPNLVYGRDFEGDVIELSQSLYVPNRAHIYKGLPHQIPHPYHSF